MRCGLDTCASAAVAPISAVKKAWQAGLFRRRSSKPVSCVPSVGGAFRRARGAMRRRALLLCWAAAALAALLAPRGAGGDEVVPAFVDDRAAAHVPHGREWNYTLTPHMLARSITGYGATLDCRKDRQTQAELPHRVLATRCGAWWPSLTLGGLSWSLSLAVACQEATADPTAPATTTEATPGRGRGLSTTTSTPGGQAGTTCTLTALFPPRVCGARWRHPWQGA